jgi:cGMP-dependent protein kinase 1
MGSCTSKTQLKEVKKNGLDSSSNQIIPDGPQGPLVNRKHNKHKAAVIDSRFAVELYTEASSAEILEIQKTPKEIALIKNSLAKHFIFRTLKENYIHVIIHHMKLYNLKNSEFVFEQGRPGNNFYVVSKGKLEVVVNSKCVKLLNSGDSFGEMALLHDTPRTASVLSVTNCSLWCLDRKTFRSTVEALELVNYEENKLFINSIPIFESLTPNQKENLLHSLTSHFFIPGSVIVNEGDPGDLLYIIKEGIVLITKDNQEVRKMGKGFYFGEQALLYSSVRTATVTAIDDVKCVTISGEKLTKVLGNQLYDIIFTNSIRISLEKNKILQKLTKFQSEVLIKVMKIKTFTDGEIVIKPDTSLKDYMYIVVRGLLKSQNKSIVIGKVFDAINVENMIKSTPGVFEDTIVAVDETSVAFISKLDFETKLGGSFEEVTSNNDAFKILKRIQIFKGLSSASMQGMIKSMTISEYRDNDTVVEQDDTGDAFFIVKSGKAIVFKDGYNLRTITKHDYFGERSLLFNNFRSATVKAKGNLVCWVILKSTFIEFLDDNVKKQLLARIELQDDTVSLEDLLIVKSLGNGMFGNVFLTIHKTKKMFYALKTVDRRKINAYEIQENIVLERRILLELDHIFIMKMIRTFKDNFRLYFLLEHIRGMDLFDVIRELGLLSDGDSKFYAACIVTILEHLHERDIIYRDLKPENIVVDDEGYLKLIDFGTGKIIKGRTFTIVGTPHYMAPEVISGHGYSLSADYWSLGVIVYEFMYGKVPFGDEESDPYAIYEKIQERALDFPKWADKKGKSKEFIAQMLSRNPAKRLGGSFDNLKSNLWFQNFDWDKLLSKALKPPCKPKQPNLKIDIENAFLTQKTMQETIAKVEAKSSIPAPRKKPAKVSPDWDQEF